MLTLLVSLAGLLLVGFVVAINIHGRRLGKHEAWIERLEKVLDNLHAERHRNYVQQLQRVTHKTRVPVPPGTIQVTDDMLITSDEKKDTR